VSLGGKHIISTSHAYSEGSCWVQSQIIVVPPSAGRDGAAGWPLQEIRLFIRGMGIRQYHSRHFQHFLYRNPIPAIPLYCAINIIAQYKYVVSPPPPLVLPFNLQYYWSWQYQYRAKVKLQAAGAGFEHEHVGRWVRPRSLHDIAITDILYMVYGIKRGGHRWGGGMYHVCRM